MLTIGLLLTLINVLIGGAKSLWKTVDENKPGKFVWDLFEWVIMILTLLLTIGFINGGGLPW